MELIRIKRWRSNRLSALSLNERLKPVIVGLVVLLLGNTVIASEEVKTSEMMRALQSQVRNLSEALVSAKMEIDYLKARLENRACEATESTGLLLGGSAILREKEYLILDVNKELGMVVLNGGRRDGIKPGLLFTVINGDKSVATVRIVESRSAIAGAIIQNADRELPKVQDRVVLAAGSKN